MKKLVLVLAILAAIVAGTIYALPNLATKAAETALSHTLQTPVTVSGVDISVADTTFTVKQVTIKDYPEYSKGNMFVLNDLVVKLDPYNVYNNFYNIEDFYINNAELKLTGSLNHNSLKHALDIVKANEEKDLQVAEQHQAAAEKAGTTHDHAAHQAKFRIGNVRINELALTAHVTKPIKLDAKTFALKNINIKEIGGDNGANLNTLVKDITTDLDKAVEAEIAKHIPAQKVFEDTEKVLKQGLEQGKEKADELLKKYF